MDTQKKIIVELDGERLDKFISGKTDGMSRSRIANLISLGMATLNGVKVKSSQRLKAGDIIEINLTEPSAPRLKPQDIDLNVIFEEGRTIDCIFEELALRRRNSSNSREKSDDIVSLDMCDTHASEKVRIDKF